MCSQWYISDKIGDHTGWAHTNDGQEPWDTEAARCCHQCLALTATFVLGHLARVLWWRMAQQGSEP